MVDEKKMMMMMMMKQQTVDLSIRMQPRSMFTSDTLWMKQDLSTQKGQNAKSSEHRMRQDERRQLKISHNEMKWDPLKQQKDLCWYADSCKFTDPLTNEMRPDKLMRQKERWQKWNKINQGEIKRDRWHSKKKTLLQQSFSLLITEQSLQEPRRSLSANRVLSY